MDNGLPQPHLAAQLKQRASGKKQENKALLKRMNKMKDAEVDALFHQAHEEVFACTDCLQCANCCKTTGPLFTNKDIDRIAKYLRLRPAQFAERHLRQDEDGDMVLQVLPCPFLGPDNRCGIYDVRPKACREYPHTDRRNIREIQNLTLKNASICPAVLDIFDKVRNRLATR